LYIEASRQIAYTLAPGKSITPLVNYISMNIVALEDIGISFNIIHDRTAYLNIVFAALINRIEGGIRKFLEYLTAYLDLGGVINQFPDSLSDGENQRVAIARTMIDQPEMLLTGEPAGNLDEKIVKRICSSFGDQRDRKGMSVIVTTHNRLHKKK
jgi:ABC-type ATPase involved in cell division